MKHFFNHVWKFFFRGLIAAIPLTLSYFAVKLLYITIDKPVNSFVFEYTGFQIYGLGVMVTLIAFYLIGLLASNVIGKQIFGFIENISNRIPLIKTTYQVGKQISSTLSLPEKQVFKRVVLVDFTHKGVWAIGFVTGPLKNDRGEVLLKVFIPTTPNPTTGFVIVVKESEVLDPGWNVEEGMKLVISGGIIGPEKIK